MMKQNYTADSVRSRNGQYSGTGTNYAVTDGKKVCGSKNGSPETFSNNFNTSRIATNRSSWMDSICRISCSSVRFSSADCSSISVLSSIDSGSAEDCGDSATAAAALSLWQQHQHQWYHTAQPARCSHFHLHNSCFSKTTKLHHRQQYKTFLVTFSACNCDNDIDQVHTVTMIKLWFQYSFLLTAKLVS